MRRLMASMTAVLAAGLVAACGEVVTPTEPGAGPLLRAAAANEAVIVVFRDDVANPRGLAQQLAAAAGGAPTFTYAHAIKGFAGSFPAAAVEALRRNPNVAWVEADGEVRTTSTTQTNATWGLDRIDQRDLPLSMTYTYAATGAGVEAYIIDTGIRFGHVDFGGRAVTGYDAITAGGTAEDCDGHGTHVAGTVGGATWGVAKGVTLYAVRVLNCQGSGTWSQVIAGVDYVTNRKQTNPGTPMVANMSLGGGGSSSLDAAVRNSTAAGVTYAVAAGNSNANACNYSPAREASAITVGATTSSDARASYSNFGSCLDLFAPGSSITSAWYTSNTATNTISGTSMASPHVAGAAALYLQGNPNASPAAVATALTGNATPNKVTGAGTGSPNLLLFTGFITGGGGAEPPPPPPPPTGDNIMLSGSSRGNKKWSFADLDWTGSSASQVDVFQGTTKVATTSNSGSYTHQFPAVSGSRTYKVCNAGTTVCSNGVILSW